MNLVQWATRVHASEARFKTGEEVEAEKKRMGDSGTQLTFAIRVKMIWKKGASQEALNDCSRRVRASYDKMHEHRLKDSANRSLVSIVKCIIKQQLNANHVVFIVPGWCSQTPALGLFDASLG